MNHKPIDYNQWNFDGQGDNIIDRLSLIELKIWEAALPLQDKRDDTGHAEYVTYFALQLLDHYNNMNREIVVPAAILHDTGWSQLSQTERNLFADPNMKRYEPALRARHQEEGVEIAKKTLEKVGYGQGCIPEILEIISEHDTRDGFLSLNDGLVRDADKLWRFTVTEFTTCVFHRGKNVEHMVQQRTDWIKKPGFFYSDISKEVARIELENILNNSHFYTRE